MSLQQRLEHVERENLRLKLIAMGLLILGGMFLTVNLGPGFLQLADGQEKSDSASKGKEGTKENIATEAKRQQELVKNKKLFPIELDILRQTMNICCSSPVPNGWIKVNDSWSPTSCGNPSTIVYNVCTIEKYSDKPIGAVMNVCASAPTPAGWVEVNYVWSPTSCGYPSTMVNNVKQIKRVN
jgi:hypothetical protein